MVWLFICLAVLRFHKATAALFSSIDLSILQAQAEIEMSQPPAADVEAGARLASLRQGEMNTAPLTNSLGCGPDGSEGFNHLSFLKRICILDALKL